MESLIEKLNRHNTELIFGKGATIDQVKNAESALNVHFADDYVQCLLKYGVFAFNGHEMTGITEISRINVVNVTQRQRELNSVLPADWYVIEEANMDGFVIWQDSNSIIYCSTPVSEPIPIAGNLATYLGV